MRTPALSPLQRELPPVDGAGAPAAVGGAPAGGGFADALVRAVGDVDALQAAADRDAHDVALGRGNLHETALALEKADVALRVAVKVRNKLVEAYQDVMRMPV
jgi:flagellar hook-basal body complex protein FliE